MRFTLLSYNIHRAIGVDRRFEPQRIIDVLAHHNADVVLLQEVDRGAPRSDHLDLASLLARALEYPYRASGMNVSMRRGKYGNATLSRFPIGEQRNIDLTMGWRKRRGAQHTRVFLHKGVQHSRLDIFNVHLGLSAQERMRQIARLMHTRDVAGLETTHPCIIAGDMNDWRGLLQRQFCDQAGFACATNRAHDSRWSIRTFPSYAPTGGLDKIFFRGGMRLLSVHTSRMRLARIASDHLPVIAEFELT